MGNKLIICCFLTAFATVSQHSGAQNINPDISVIGDVRAFVTDDASDPKEGNLQLDLESVELALQGYLNPFVRGDVFAAYTENEGFVVEEAFATILRGLPAGLQVKAGRYRVDFGKLNLLHPHAYAFLETPLVHQQYLGAEGLMDVGVNLNMQIPLGNLVLTPSVNVLKGGFVGEWIQDTPAGPNGELETDLGWSERLSLFVPTGDYAGFEAGLSALQDTFDAATGRQVALLGADFKYRWAPNKYRSLTVQGEWIRSRRDVLGQGSDISRVTADGYYAFADYRFAQRWDIGAIGERAEGADDAGNTTTRVGLFGGFQVMEETTMLRVLLRQTDGDDYQDPVNEAILQLVFSLGPHKAHWF
ncbi:MAG: hypothetical protein V1750_00750 [Acidobacteriota bacterium]